MIAVGLTGSIGMGKSTVMRMFAEEGAAVWNADEAVHRLYEPGAAGAVAVAKRFAEVVDERGVDREKLSVLVLNNAEALEDLEAIIHPLVAEDRAKFLTAAAKDDADIAVLDVPLLFEKGVEKYFDAIVVVSAPADEQKKRVLARPGMTEKKFRAILMKQTPDAEKRRRADYVIDTGVSLEQTQKLVRCTMAALRKRFGIGA